MQISKNSRYPQLSFVLVAMGFFTTGTLYSGEVNLGTESEREAGKKMYLNFCAHCHGVDGDGKGSASRYFHPKPRDFTGGKYKLRSTDSGELPTDEDIIQVIKKGMPYTGMPAFSDFSEEEYQNLTYYLKSFNEDFTDQDFIVDPLNFPKAPPYSEESALKGKELYIANECNGCHGDYGRSDGVSAPTLEDDFGEVKYHLRPADLTKRWTFRRGATREDMYRAFTTGLNGTPMPSYKESITPEDRWQLVNYIYSLSERDEPKYSTTIIAEYIEEEINLSQSESLFENSEVALFPVVGQVIEPGREFFPSAKAIEVRAVYNQEAIAFKLSWNDMKAEVEGSNAPDVAVEKFYLDETEGRDKVLVVEDRPTKYSDAVALQFPSSLPDGFKKPYFLYGDDKNTVDITFLDLADENEVKRYTGFGYDRLSAVENDDVSAFSNYDNGEWSVIFKRNRNLEAEEGLSFVEETFIPLSFYVWDGFNNERGIDSGISSWYSLYLKSSEKESPVIPMIIYGLLTLFIELIIVFLMRKKFSTV